MTLLCMCQNQETLANVLNIHHNPACTWTSHCSSMSSFAASYNGYMAPTAPIKPWEGLAPHGCFGMHGATPQFTSHRLGRYRYCTASLRATPSSPSHLSLQALPGFQEESVPMICKCRNAKRSLVAATDQLHFQSSLQKPSNQLLNF